MNRNGIFCPLITPFDHSEELYPAKVLHNVSRLNEVALEGYVVGSRTGEGEMLGLDERERLFEIVASATSKPLVVATSDPGVRQAVRTIEAAARHRFQAAIIESADPYHRACIADRSPLPILNEPLNAPPAVNAVPYVYVTIFEAERSRDLDAANDWRSRVAAAEAIVEKYGVGAVKAAMDSFGYYGGPVRLPRVRLNAGETAEVAAAFRDLRG